MYIGISKYYLYEGRALGDEMYYFFIKVSTFGDILQLSIEPSVHVEPEENSEKTDASQ
jgi:hypothetical protein